MKRFRILGLSAALVLGVASISDSAMAQQKVSRDQLVGTWTFVTCTETNGTTPAFCLNRNGRMMFDAMGHYMFSAAPSGRQNPLTGNNTRARLSGDQFKAMTDGFVSNFGNWSFNDADQTLTQTAEIALFPNNEGREQKWKVNLTGDELQRVAAGGTDIWRRAK
jgi:hypothetical protein